MPGIDELTERQRHILEYIRQAVRERGYPPSVREICQAVGLKSTSSVHAQLATLEQAGFLRRDASRPRAIEVLAAAHEPDFQPDTAPGQAVPLVGHIAAGAPTVAEQQTIEHYSLPSALVGDGTLFMLQVRGESMLEAGVLPGDYVVVRQQPTVEQGEMCAALIEGEATVKFFRRTPAGEVFLDPANAAFDPVPVNPDENAAVLGKVTAVLRRL